MFDDVRAAGRQARVLRRAEHRPWPLPERGWLLGQTLEDVLLAHWHVPEETVRPHVPSGLELDLHDGSAWIGIVGFRTAAVRVRGMLPVPRLSSYLELNVRTYVRAADERPGVWFFSLDASSRFAVQAARRSYRLPYHHARLALDRSGDWRDLECARVAERGKVFSGRYRPVGPTSAAEPGSLEWFLAERYCLYVAGRGSDLQRADVHHDLWPLQPAEGEIELTTIAPFELRGAPVCHFAARQDLLAWPLEPVGSSR